MDINSAIITPDASVNAAEQAKLLQRSTTTAASASSAGVTEKQRQQAKKVSQDFEALFVGMMMKSMRATVGKDELTGGGHGEDAYQSMLDQEYAAVAVKRAGGLGLAKMIEKDIIRQESRKVAPVISIKE